ncbi:Selenocysteine-specific elongation factor [Blattella germanica]|nr:Selenocysteine-specific elongation factor [Blattella germanica]
MENPVLNLNIGILGHVDSGKTSLAKALSTIASTAAFDKNPQSQERGITIDLGFSSFVIDMPDHLKNSTKSDKLQFTLVDCPGHASLIRTIIGGAQIIDLMLLVIDVTKGMQTQTAECLVIGEITCKKMIVVLNKIDLLEEGKRANLIEKALVEMLKKFAFVPERHMSQPFLFAVDHCFSVRGQGTVMTGTVLQGSVSVNDTIEVPSMRITKKVKSMQMFKKPIERAGQGDRIGLCVTQFDPKQLERGVACAPGYVVTLSAAILVVHKIKYFKSNVCTKSKYHISIGHETVMGKLTFFGRTQIFNEEESSLNYNEEYKYQEELLPSMEQDAEKGTAFKQYAIVEFEKPVSAVPGALVIGSKLDMDIHVNSCRLAFWGHLLETIEDKNYSSNVLSKIKIYKEKRKVGVVERASNEYEVIGKGMFKKETNIQLFVGLKVDLSTGETGIIESSFGQSGKTKIRIPDGLKENTFAQLSNTGRRRGKQASEAQTSPSDNEPVEVVLNFKRYVYDPQKKIIQL